MEPILPDRPYPLHDCAATRRLESRLQATLPAQALMQRAGHATARLALALAPHARTVWIACGPGNNGGDGLEAALQLQAWGRRPHVTWLGDPARLPADARAALQRARSAGVELAERPPAALGPGDLCIDALLGIGASRPAQGELRDTILHLQALRGQAAVLAVDVPSGLDADRGCPPPASGGGDSLFVRADHTLSLLSLKPGLFTALGRDAAGRVWFDDLGAGAAAAEPPTALLLGPAAAAARPHASHKGSFGDVAVVGGAAGMTGAALLAARAALHAGAGRVFVALLDGGSITADAAQPELMFRRPDDTSWGGATVVCGCGGGDAVRAVLPRLLSTAAGLVLDANALNAVAADAALQTLLRARAAQGRGTVLTPHPLEAARLLGSGTADVQADRVAAARELAERYRCTAALKGSGTVVAAPGQLPALNPTGNARLATAGTGDVLAGLTGARLAAGLPPWEAACAAVHLHGALAEHWPAGEPLVAGRLASRLTAHGVR